MFYIKSDKGYFNSTFNCWESDIKNATQYYTYDTAMVVAEVVGIGDNIRTEVVG